MAEGQGDMPVKSAEMPHEMKTPGFQWLVAEQIPESPKKRLNWL